MKPSTIIEIPAGALAAMTVEQFQALQGLCSEGSWDSVRGPIRVSGGDYLGVYLPGLFVGIERDGHTHT